MCAAQSAFASGPIPSVVRVIEIFRFTAVLRVPPSCREPKDRGPRLLLKRMDKLEVGRLLAKIDTIQALFEHVRQRRGEASLVLLAQVKMALDCIDLHRQ